jgi:hypothetical protein
MYYNIVHSEAIRNDPAGLVSGARSYFFLSSPATAAARRATSSASPR